jgi:hypothetical protein
MFFWTPGGDCVGSSVRRDDRHEEKVFGVHVLEGLRQVQHHGRSFTDRDFYAFPQQMTAQSALFTTLKKLGVACANIIYSKINQQPILRL